MLKSSFGAPKAKLFQPREAVGIQVQADMQIMRCER